MDKRKIALGIYEYHLADGTIVVWDNPYKHENRSCELCKRTQCHLVRHHFAGYESDETWLICHSCNRRLYGVHDGSLTKQEAEKFITTQSGCYLMHPSTPGSQKRRKLHSERIKKGLLRKKLQEMNQP